MALGSLSRLTWLKAGNFNVSRAWLRGGFKALDSLTYGGQYYNRGLKHVLPLPVLKSLSVFGLDAVSDQAMAVLALQTSLRTLRLQGGYQLSCKGLQQLAAGLPRLERLELAACPHISR